MKVGFCISTCGEYLTVPTIDPSVFTYVLDGDSKGEDIALPGFWSYASTDFATIYKYCGLPQITTAGVEPYIAVVDLIDEDNDKVYDLNMFVDLAAGDDVAGNYTINITASYDGDPNAAIVTTSV